MNEQNNQDPNYFYRVNFPAGTTGYQTIISISKFEKDYKQPPLEYRFLNAYPISIDSMPVSYEGVNTLKCTVNFNFSRYFTPVTVLKRAPYPITGSSDSSKWIAGQGLNESGVIAKTNKLAIEGADFDHTALNETLNN